MQKSMQYTHTHSACTSPAGDTTSAEYVHFDQLTRRSLLGRLPAGTRIAILDIVEMAAAQRRALLMERPARDNRRSLVGGVG